jgi:hypothetical protein
MSFGQSVVKNFCLVYERANPQKFHEGGLHYDIGVEIARPHRKHRLNSRDTDERTMLVDYIEFVKQPEPMRLKSIPSVIWLQTLDNCLGTWIDMPELARRFLLELIGGVEFMKNREFGFSGERIGKRAFVKVLRQGKNRMIEATSQVVQAVSDDRRNPRGRPKIASESDYIKSSFWVELVGEGVGFFHNPLIDCGCTALQVLVRTM